MTSNKLKIIACVSMALDHIGFVLFPTITVFRYMGRLALPIFAFFIAEGCIHTRSKVKYFLQMLSLALFCQIFYIAEELMSGKISRIYLNVLFTFCLSIIVSVTYISFVNSIKKGDKKKSVVLGLAFLSSILFVVFCCTELTKIFGVKITVDYGIVGALLPLWAVIFTDKKKRLIAFSLGTIIYCLGHAATQPYVWYSLLALPLIALYNGERGSKKLKWAFYLFYPLHFAVIYGISLLK